LKAQAISTSKLGITCFLGGRNQVGTLDGSELGAE